MDIKTLNQFTKWIESLDAGKYVFRGVADEKYEIEATTYLRLKDKNGNFINEMDNSPKNLLKINQEIINQARHQGHYRELNDLELLAELQHFGAATCLIDFTKNPFVALWMACREESGKNTNGKVYAVNIEDQNEFNIVDYDLLTKDIFEFFERDEQNKYRLYQWVPNSQNNGRVLVQQSIFLFGGAKVVETYHYVIPEGSKDILKRELDRLFGINEESLFPDFAGFARQCAYDRPYDRTDIQSGAETSQAIDDEFQNEFLAEAYLDLGRETYQNGKVDEAVQTLSHGISLRPSESLLSRLYSERAFAYYNTGELQSALDDYNESIRLIADDPNIYYWRGRVRYDMETYGEAVRDFTQAINLNPRDAQYYYWRAMAFYEQEIYAEAMFNFNQAIDLSPGDAQYYYQRAMVSFKLRMYEDSISDFNSAIRIDPVNADSYYWRGLAQYNLKRYAETIFDLDQAIALNSEEAQYYYQRSIVKKDLEMFGESRNDLQIASFYARMEKNYTLMELIHHEYTQTLSDLPEYEQEFAEAIIDIVENKKRRYDEDYGEDKIEHVPLKNIDFSIKDFENNIGIPILQEIAKRRGKPRDENWQVTAQHMLDSFCRVGEIYVYLNKKEHGVPIDRYRLSREGSIYKRLADKLLESTP